MSILFSEENFGNFGKCLVLKNGICTVKITISVGPRVLYYALDGMENILKEDARRSVVRDSEDLHRFFDTQENWYIYGGHRLWSSPESWPESYTPDNAPVPYQTDGNTVVLTPADRVKVGERHTMTVTLDENSSLLTIGHRIENISDRERLLAPWCLTVADKGGIELLPQCRRKSGLLSNRRLVIWEYTNINDDRFFLDNDYMTLCQTDKRQSFKVGMNNEDGWCAYLNKGQLFKKSFGFDPKAEYPDFGCNCETFTDAEIMEIESLGALRTLRPGEAAEHEERWELFPCPNRFDPRSPEEIRAFAEKYKLS